MSDKSDNKETKPDIPAPDETPEVVESAPHKPAKSRKSPKEQLKHLLDLYLSKKKLTIPLTVLLVLGIVMAIPFTRYTVLGLVIKKDFSILVVDSTLSRPVSKAQVSIGGKTVETDAKGKATVNLSVGTKELKVTKKYYKGYSEKVLVPLNQKKPQEVALSATGLEVSLSVTNKITGKPVQSAVVAAEGTEVKTDKDGKAVMVLPLIKKSPGAGSRSYNITINGQGFNELKHFLSVSIGGESKEHKYQIVPSGKVYFLSKASGKIDVVKTNLDGTERQTVLAGTGKEEQFNTVLLASRDWKYLALHSKRDGGKNAKLFLINTSTDKVINMDEGDAYFTIAGWSDQRFIYVVNRAKTSDCQTKRQALKSFNAPAGKITLLDETTAEGTSTYDCAFNIYGSKVYILNNELFFNKNWGGEGGRFGDKKFTYTTVKADGSGKKIVKEFPLPAGTCCYFHSETQLYAPNEIYLEVPTSSSHSTYHEYEDGKVVAKPDATSEKFYEEYPRFILSPSGKQNLWFDKRDGKNAMFIGDADGKNEKQIGSLSEYAAYGWYTDDYLLVSKNDSELYIMPAGGGDPFKITDYHKPNFNYRGYGGGY